MARKYLDFDLAIEPSGDQYVARVLRSPAGEAESVFEWPFSPQDLEILVLRIGHTRRGTRRSDSPEMRYARDFGRALYDTVFQGAARTTLIRSIDEAERRDAGLRIRLRLGSSPLLRDVPWEYLYSEDLNRFLIVSAETPIVRYIDLQRRVRPITASLPLQILAVVSAPSNLPELDVQGEWERLQHALAGLVERGAVTLERLETPTLEELQERLRRGQVHVLHFIGHGAFDPGSDEGVLFFTNDRGGSHAVTGEDLGTVLHDHRALRLVILNSCEGARSDPADPFSGSAQALVGQGIPAVIAMQFEITDKAALTIAKNFYGSLADGYAVDAALAEARKAIFSQGNDVEWGTPVLYMRAPDGQLFDIGKASAVKAPAAVKPEAETDVLLREARAAAAQQDWAGAIAQLKKLLDKDPEHTAAQALLEQARRHQRAAKWYRGARFLAAAEQWEAVLERFRDIDALDVPIEDPDGLRQKALDALQARRIAERLDEQLEQARKSLADSDWTLASQTAGAVLAEHPQHDEAQRIAAEATARAAVEELYDLARNAASEERWGEVLKRFEEIEAIGINYLVDPDGLRAQAVAGQAEQARLQDLDARYEGAIALIDAQQWDQALSIIDALVADEPGYRGAEKLRDRVATELEAKQRSKGQAMAERRYVDAVRSAAAGDWEVVVEALDAIDDLAPDFGDPENLRRRAEDAKATVADSVEVEEPPKLQCGADEGSQIPEPEVAMQTEAVVETRQRSVESLASSANDTQSHAGRQDTRLGDLEDAVRQGLPWLLFSFEGRLWKRGYWGGVAAVLGVGVVAIAVLAVLYDMSTSTMQTTITVIALGVGVLMIWSLTALVVKRAHDSGERTRRAVVMAITSFVLGIWLVGLPVIAVLIVTGRKAGTTGPNQFGNQPVR